MYASDLTHPNQTLEDKLKALYALRRDHKIDLSFRPPYLSLLESFGNPHLNLPPVIHVAGTNGKGSTIAFLKSVLEQQGYRVHAYTSPHLIKMNERIYLAGQDITDSALETLIDSVLNHKGSKDLTFFEATTAMAFKAFADTPADIALIEVGLGGRLDCTNVIPNPALTIITQIGYDHMEFLGNTLEEIAAEKAGIMKEEIPCVIGAQFHAPDQANILNVFQRRSSQLKAPLIKANDNIGDMRPGLIGAHQAQNAAIALKALEALKDRFEISDKAIQDGLARASWKARLQNLTGKMNASCDWEIFLDGGHNEDAARVIKSQFQTWQANDPKNLHLIIGMMAHKNPKTYLAPLLPFAETLSIVPISGEQDALNEDRLKEILSAQDVEIEGRFFKNVDAAIAHITNNHAPARIFIGGSLYLAGNVLQNLHNDAHNRS